MLNIIRDQGDDNLLWDINNYQCLKLKITRSPDNSKAVEKKDQF